VAESSVFRLQGHISFPLLLDLSPFAGGTFSTGQGPGPSAMNKQIYDLPSLHLYQQLNAQMPINTFPTGGNSSSQPRKDEVSNGGGCSLYKACCLHSNNFYLISLYG
jgi:ubiquitin carboxyl-terminal hydrolase 30